eukprot:m.239553 g.239553  ORF g.239553 m.239553 type:complete len:147 (-) comp26259_c0_seq7:53-493(-)
MALLQSNRVRQRGATALLERCGLPPSLATATMAIFVGSLLVGLPSCASADLSCFEWPSVLDPSETVHYLTSTTCSEDLAALGRVPGFEHLKSNTEVGCSNAVGMLFFAQSCNATLESLVSPKCTPPPSPPPSCRRYRQAHTRTLVI